MGMMYEPNKITATLKVVIGGEFYDDEASEETLRYCVEQNLEDAGFDVDVELLKEREPVKAERRVEQTEFNVCGYCGAHLLHRFRFCPECGRAVKWE